MFNIIDMHSMLALACNSCTILVSCVECCSEIVIGLLTDGRVHTHTHTHTLLTTLCPGLPGSASTRKVKPIWILLKQETLSSSGISWAICKSAPRSRQITTPAPHHSVFRGRMPFLPPNQQHQSTEGTDGRVEYKIFSFPFPLVYYTEMHNILKRW